MASRNMYHPHDIHWISAKRILNLVQGTKTHGIHYVVKYDLELVGFTDSDWAGDSTDRKINLWICVYACRWTNILVK